METPTPKHPNFQIIKRVATNFFEFYRNISDKQSIQFEIKSAMIKKKFPIAQTKLKHKKGEQTQYTPFNQADFYQDYHEVPSNNKVNAGLKTEEQYLKLRDKLLELYSYLPQNNAPHTFIRFYLKHNNDNAIGYNFGTKKWQNYFKRRKHGNLDQVNLKRKSLIYRLAISQKQTKTGLDTNQKIQEEFLRLLSLPIKEQRCFRVFQQTIFPVSEGQIIKLSRVLQFDQKEFSDQADFIGKMVYKQSYYKLCKFFREGFLGSGNYQLGYEGQYIVDRYPEIDKKSEQEMFEFIRDRMIFYNDLDVAAAGENSQQTNLGLVKSLKYFLQSGKNKQKELYSVDYDKKGILDKGQQKQIKPKIQKKQFKKHQTESSENDED